MKVIEVCRVWTTHLMGGMPIAAHYHARALKERGHDVTVVTTLHQTMGACTLEVDGIPIHHLPGTNPMSADGRFDTALLRFYDETGPYDVVHSQSGGGKALCGKTATVLSLHGFGLQNAHNELALYQDTGDDRHLDRARSMFIDGFRERETFEQFDAITALSPHTYSDLTERMFLENVHLVPNGIDLERFKNIPPTVRTVIRGKFGIPDDAKIILTACHLARYKGVHHLVQAIPRILERVPNAYALILGDGPERARLGPMADELGCGSRVLLPGEVENGVMPDYYAAADVFFSGSFHYSGLDMNVLEAMASGCPVVGCHSPGKGWVLRHNITGLSYSLIFPADVISCVLRVLNESSATRGLVKCAQNNVQQLFSLSALGENLERVFAEVV